MTNTLDSTNIQRIAEDVWHDRLAILSGDEGSSPEATLAQAFYWRLCKAGHKPGESFKEFAPFLKKLVEQCRDEAAQRADVRE